MGKTRRSADLVSDNNIFVSISNDRVGIGSTIPAGKLDIAGNILINGTEVINSSGVWQGGSIDAATLDSLDSSQFLRSDADDWTTGQLTADTLLITNDASDTSRHRIAVYDSGNISYGMALWNTNGTSGDWATMIYGPNQSGRRISFGKINDTTYSNHADITEIAYFDLDDSTLRLDADAYVGSDKVWHAGNDGTGSGLDADTVDGIEGANFLRSDTSDTMNGVLYVGGTSVSGNEGGEMRLTHAPNSTLAGSNIVIDSYLNKIRFFEDGSNLRGAYLQLSDQANSAASKILTDADEGSGNGLDADTVDGIEASSFLRSDADDTATGNIHITGTLRVGNATDTTQPQFFIKNAVNASDADYNDAALMYLAAGDSDHNGFLMDLDDDDLYTQSGNNEFVFKIRTKDNAIASATDADTKFLIRPSGRVLINYGATDQVSGDPYLAVNGTVAATSFSGDGSNITNIKTGFSPINFVLS